LGCCDSQLQLVTNRPQMIRTIVCDKTTTVFTAQTVSSALNAREKNGQGDHIQVAMLDIMISLMRAVALTKRPPVVGVDGR
jgi:crotonobetainyl-CoA:carnitine CoA-transferase CaiB-like acyl-CoA transferase